MKFWHLFRTNAGDVTYDEYDAFVIEAATESEAREIACNNPGDEGSVWRDPDRVRCEELVTSGTPGVIIGSFNAG
jgi:hypothetical protein